MEKTRLSAEIMNIQTAPDKEGYACSLALGSDTLEKAVTLSYRLGHKDARHDAAELALKD